LVSYRQLDQHGIKQILVSSSGRPKAQSLTQEDADFVYRYDNRGALLSKTPKDYLSKYIWWHKHNVKFAPVGKNGIFGNQRITPLSEFEKAMGVRMAIPSFRYHWCAGTHRDGYTYGCQEGTYTQKDWEIFKQTHTIDSGNLEVIYKTDLPTDIGQGHKDWNTYFTTKAREKDLIVVNMANLVFREKQKPAVVEKVRPIPKEVEKVEPVEVEPINEAVKYSPLMIAGVIAVVVILLLKRRRA